MLLEPLSFGNARVGAARQLHALTVPTRQPIDRCAEQLLAPHG